MKVIKSKMPMNRICITCKSTIAIEKKDIFIDKYKNVMGFEFDRLIFTCCECGRSQPLKDD